MANNKLGWRLLGAAAAVLSATSLVTACSADDSPILTPESAIVSTTTAPLTTLSRDRIVELQNKLDGKDPRGLDGKDSKCADPPASKPVESSKPGVPGPEGGTVGTIELRGSTDPNCPTAAWARVTWNTADGKWRIPKDWTLHVVSHRPDTNTAIDEPEPATDSDIPYALGSMIVAGTDCIYYEAFFTHIDGRVTEPATTSCVEVPMR